uniref:Uncharacterized protein n=1 Tax=Cannabis sativa TaxID=3483 RepID=A0A803QJ91_CANSA
MPSTRMEEKAKGMEKRMERKEANMNSIKANLSSIILDLKHHQRFLKISESQTLAYQFEKMEMAIRDCNCTFARLASFREGVGETRTALSDHSPSCSSVLGARRINNSGRLVSSSG